ncbi:MAG: HDIG domain-containing protein [candidate division Zixibacteria bacterium]|nr:HDIG domain-containing protein [candidate division Zixibacteria bacterium]
MYKILLRTKRFIKSFIKVKSETRQMPVLGARHKVNKYVMLILATALIALLYPTENLFYPLDFPKVGETAREDIISPFQIIIVKSESELQQERIESASAIPIIIEYDNTIVDSVFSKYNKFMNSADSAAKIVQSIRSDSAVGERQVDSIINEFTGDISQLYPLMNINSINRLIKENNVSKPDSVIEKNLRENIYFTGIMSDINLLPEHKSNSVIVRIGKRDVFLVRDKLLDRSLAYANFRNNLKSKALTDNFDIDYFYDLGKNFIIPNLVLNTGEMEIRQETAINEIKPIKETVSEGDLIVRAGTKISERQQEILRKVYHQRTLQAEEKGLYEQYMPVIARTLLVLLIFSFLYLYFYHFKKQIYNSNPKILAIFLIIALELVLIYVVDVKLNLPEYIFPIIIFSILITILFDPETGIFTTFALALLLGVLHRFSFPLVLITVVSGTIACFTTRQVRQRSEFFKSILYLSITYILLIYVIESFDISNTKGEILNLIGLGILNAAISPLLAIGLLPVFESLFGFTTDITLLELSDMNRPLLKRLAIEAPGSYHHSIIVGNLAEAAAKAINANSLLARVGAYYHDIGKIEIPEYFVENQLGIKSKHQDLTPTMSAIILSSHVKKGRFIGEEADLPDEVLNFIEEHHGTMPMPYFYNKAKELGEDAPDINEFSYPGPKPQIRETAIVMLADSVEAASRTLSDPKPSRISNLVQNIINDRFQSGELEDCPLTLKDLAQIRESFVQILIGVFHHRVEYPKKEIVE